MWKFRRRRRRGLLRTESAMRILMMTQTNSSIPRRPLQPIEKLFAVRLCVSVFMCFCPCVPLSLCASVLVCLCPCVFLFLCASVLVCLCPCVPLSLCASVLVCFCTLSYLMIVRLIGRCDESLLHQTSP